MTTITDGTYRFKNDSDNGGNNYFTLTGTGQVKGAPLDAGSDTQKWTVTRRSDGHYDIANAGTDALLAVASPSPSTGETEYTLSVSGDNATSWDVVLSGGRAILQPTGGFADGKVTDLSVGDRIILWESNRLPNQSWTPELAEPPVQPTWVSVQGTNIPANAIVGGHESDEPTLYVARAVPVAGEYHPGKAGRQLPGNCRVPWNYAETVTSNYQVLVASPGTYRWVSIPDGTPFDISTVPRPIIGGNAAIYGTLYVARATVNGAVIPGKAYQAGLWVGLDGVEIGSPPNGREVLCYV